VTAMCMPGFKGLPSGSLLAMVVGFSIYVVGKLRRTVRQLS
jgi:hypothetical protein